MKSFTRIMVLLVITVGLPILALPKVRQRVEDWVYGQVDRIIPPLPAKAQAAQAIPEFAPLGPNANVGFNETPSAPPLTPLPGATRVPAKPFHDLRPAPPPDLTPIPGNPSGNFPPSYPSNPLPPTPPPGENPPAADQAQMMAGVRRIREELEELGAEYILLETVDSGRSFRFHCEMAMDPQRRRLQPFEATTPNPLNAAEAVLDQVRQWRRQAPLPR